MTVDPQADTVDQLILDHLDHSDLPETAKDLVIAALLGGEELSSVLGGAAPRRPAPPPSDAETPEPIGTYLASIEVTGFRGIGPTATLNLVPGPGLTIVTGRNGSGKSSFAEAAEFALTGENKRWAGRSSVWQEGWRNLHATESPRIHVRLGVEGHRNGATVECNWEPGAGLDDRTAFLQITGERRQSVADLGWKQPLELYRPFLSYAELGGLLSGRPSEMHDSLHRILGLGRLVEIESMLKTARREMDDRRKLAASELPQLRSTLASHPDARARRAEQALSGKVADLDQLAVLATADEPTNDTTLVPLRQLDVLDLPEREGLVREVERLLGALRQIDDLAGTLVQEARALAKLLGDALRHYHSHPGQPCPVCGGRTLDEAWAEQTQAHLRQLTERAERLDEAHEVERESRRVLRSWLPKLPPVLALDLGVEGVESGDARGAWQHWDEMIGSADPHKIAEAALVTFDALATVLQPVKAAARQALERRQAAWQPLADQIRAWIDTEQASRQAAQMFAALRAAVTWLHQQPQRRLPGRLVVEAQRPQLRMKQVTRPGPAHLVHHRLDERQQCRARRWHDDLPRLTEHVDAVSAVSYALHHRDRVRRLPQTVRGERQRGDQQTLQVQGEGQRDGPGQPRARRRAQGVEQQRAGVRREHRQPPAGRLRSRRGYRPGSGAPAASGTPAAGCPTPRSKFAAARH
jgi:hypothetical protein